MTDSNYFSLTPYEFDQSPIGWRSVDDAGESLVAAKLIENYLLTNVEIIKAQDRVSIFTIHFHAGQEFAVTGPTYYADAVRHFKASYRGKPNWDFYVAGSIAFLQSDQPSLTTAIVGLTRLGTDKPNLRMLKAFAEGLETANHNYATIYAAN